MKLGKKLLIVSLTPHAYNLEGKPTSYEPYVREINLWCELFEEVTILTLVEPYNEKMNHKFAQFKYGNIKLVNLWSFNASKSIFHKIGQVLSIPFFKLQLIYYTLTSDFVNIRNSGLFSIVSGLIVRIFSKPSITKWAGSYSSFKGESFLTKIDRKVINISHKKHKVLVYDKVYKNHFVNFIPALMSEEEINYAQNLSKEKPNIHNRLEIVSIGRLYWAKNFELIIEALGELKKQHINFDWHYHMIGDGDLMPEIKKRATELDLLEKITFYGGLPFKKAQTILGKSHILIMPGVMEGWPKPIAEAWAHNAFPLAAKAGNIPDIIDNSEKGYVFDATNTGLINAIKESYEYLKDKDKIDMLTFVKEYSLESFKERLAVIIKDLQNVRR